MNSKEQLLLFAASTLALNRALDSVERTYDINLGRPEQIPTSEQQAATYHAQFPSALRKQAADMASDYETLFCLENSTRDLVNEKMIDAHGEGWWDQNVPQPVKETVAQNRKRESDAGVSMRSADLIDYTNFRENTPAGSSLGGALPEPGCRYPSFPLHRVRA